MKDYKQDILDLKAKYDSMEYDSYCKAMEKANRPILRQFEKYLIEKKLADKTITRHCGNVDFFVNTYQLHYDYTGTMFDGYNDFGDFIGYFFIHKCLWASESSIKGLVASLKKFYVFLAEKGYIKEEEAAEAKFILKDGTETWIEELREFDDPSGSGW